MAFVSSPSVLPRSQTRRTSPRTVIKATAANPGGNSSKTSTSSSRPHRKAPVIDSRIGSVIESHHWITVKSHRRRLFERAAVAHVDMTRQVEGRSGVGANHRWVLREVVDPSAKFLDVGESKGRYVVMETFKRGVIRERPEVLRRWLSTVERVGPMMETVDVRTRRYENVFTSKKHGVEFNPNENIVVVESINVEKGKGKEVGDVLRQVAEVAVSGGDCLEFCVLGRVGEEAEERGFVKTIEVFKNADALNEYTENADLKRTSKLNGLVAPGQRNRQIFRPVVFA